MHIVSFFSQSISPPQKEFFNYPNGIKTMPLHYIKKHLRKTILLYIIVTVGRGTYLGIVQSMKRKFVPKTRGRLTLIS